MEDSQGSEAVAARLAKHLAMSPHDRVAHHNLAVELRRLGRCEDAFAEIERAWALGLRGGETATMRGHLLGDLGRFDEAHEAYRDAIRLGPQLVEAPLALARLLPQLGRSSEALDGFRDALSLSPTTGRLWVEAMATADRHGAWAQLLEWTESAERRFGADTLISVFAARALSGLRRDGEALGLLRQVLAGEPDFVPGQGTLAHVLIRLGEWRDAEAAAEAATRAAPLDQWGWALLSTIWRLLRDPREDWLCRYDSLVMLVDLELPKGLTDALAKQHRFATHPADQSVRGGSQTTGNLFDSAYPAIVALARRLRAATEVALSRLPREREHPFLSRLTGKIAFAGSWSVALADQGYHVSHLHQEGWLSSALHVSLPPEVRAGEGQGTLTFGIPAAALEVDLPPRRIVQPREGQLVLFPSYLWHGTTPFHSVAPRLTVAFDALPAG